MISMPRSFARAALLFGFLLAVSIDALAQASVSGRVSRPGGAALSGMTVAVWSADGSGDPITTTTGSDGTYLLSLPAPASYRLVAWDPAGIYATNFYRDAGSFETSAAIEVTPGTHLRGYDMTLVEAVHLDGSVTVTGGSAAGMTVAVYNLDGTRRAFGKTNAEGGFNLTVPPGEYKLVAWDDRGLLAPQFYSNKKSFAQATIIQAAGDVGGIHFALQPAGRVSGHVIASDGGQPLSGIRVLALDLEGDEITRVNTGANGGFGFALAPGTYKFAALDELGNYETQYWRNSLTFEAGVAQPVTAGQAIFGVDFTLHQPSAPPGATILYVPAAANGPGGFGSYWQTDLWLYNPNADPLELEFLWFPQSGGERTPVTRTLPSKTQMEIRNVVQSIAGELGSGAFLIRSAAPFTGNSRTYNTPADPSSAGTFGFSVPALGLSSTLGRAILGGLTNDDLYRSNIGMFNPQPHAISVQLRLVSAEGSLLGETALELGAGGWRQDNLAAIFQGSGALSGAYLVLSSTGGSFFSWASLVDNRSNDPSFVLPSADPVAP